MSGTGLARVLAGSGPILLDFDGPVCSIFGGYPASSVATELRSILAGLDVRLPCEVAEEDDPLQILRWTATLGRPELTKAAEDALRAAEVRAVATAVPAPYSHEVFAVAQEMKHRLAIVSNNSALAIRAYLDRHGLSPYVSCIAGRKPYCPKKMKPHPHLIKEALTVLHAEPQKAVLIGDSLTDITASRQAGVRVVGYANKPGKLTSFSAAGADAVVTSLADVVTAMRQLA